MIIEKVEV